MGQKEALQAAKDRLPEKHLPPREHRLPRKQQRQSAKGLSAPDWGFSHTGLPYC